ncbi:MAG: hypothetical protein BRD50_03640 [Bacteroidetes bacterium SW_11_45_7]|nr:MAG: hypothetical protein BRD50_03640 [Bacteroidetes bacterium SW_11_45_7]
MVLLIWENDSSVEQNVIFLNWLNDHGCLLTMISNLSYHTDVVLANFFISNYFIFFTRMSIFKILEPLHS